MTTPGDRLSETVAQRSERRVAYLRALRRRQILTGLGVLAILAFPVAMFGLVKVDPDGSDDKADRASAGNPTATATRSTPQRATATTNVAVPILMYHVINTPKADTAQPELWVTREKFQAQVDELDRQGYEAVTLQRVLDAWDGKGRLPPKPIVLSFDDGYDSHFKNALPILKAKGWEGIEYLQINQTQSDLEPEEVKALKAAGWEIGVHTVSHPDVTTLDDAGLQSEVVDARKAIQDTYGVPANAFCYPAGAFNDSVIAKLKEAGYTSAVTTQDGVASPDSDRFQLERIRVNGSDDLETFKDKVAVGGFGTE